MAEALPPTASPSHSLDAREREVLRDVILLYILGAEPVSSRAVARHGSIDLSAASIRNIMADLEEDGFLAQPHTSAGRVPTREAYHLFVESLMGNRTLPAKVRRYVEEHLRETPPEPDSLITVTSHLLSELSQQVGIVLGPDLAETMLRTIEFVPLSGSRVLCVVVSGSGFADHKVVDTGQEISREELVRISNYLNQNYAGKTLREIRQSLLEALSAERAHLDRFLALTLDLASRGLDLPEGPDLVLDGTSVLLAQPELSDVTRVRRTLETFTDKARLVQILTACMDGTGVRVLIGEDSDLTSELDFSLVATRYGVGERSLGTLGILGPTRMEYQRVIPLVHYLGETLSRLLAETWEPDGASG